jgi:hypothetical protein
MKEKNREMFELLDAIKDVVEENIGMRCNEHNRVNLVRDLATRLHRDGWRKPQPHEIEDKPAKRDAAGAKP